LFGFLNGAFGLELSLMDDVFRFLAGVGDDIRLGLFCKDERAADQLFPALEVFHCRAGLNRFLPHLILHLFSAGDLACLRFLRIFHLGGQLIQKSPHFFLLVAAK
jgi:hypothetical protein